MKFKFGSYYQEDWPYSEKLGVGLDFYGYPTDVNEFFNILTSASCNEVAAIRILNVLKLNKHKQVTVVAGLFFDDIGDELKAIGVQMTIIPPFIYKNPDCIEKNLRMDFAALAEIKNSTEYSSLSNLTEEEKKEIKKRVIETKETLKKFKIL